MILNIWIYSNKICCMLNWIEPSQNYVPQIVSHLIYTGKKHCYRPFAVLCSQRLSTGADVFG